MNTNATRSSAPAGQLISRRSVVRAGAAAAWSVPLVQVVSAAPAIAQSVTKSNLAAVLTTAEYTNSSTLHIVGSVTTTGAAPTSLQMTVQLPTGVTASGADVASGNWVKQTTVSGNTVLFTASGNGTGGDFNIVLTVSPATGGTVKVIPAATNQGTVNEGAAPLATYSNSTTLQWASTIGGTYVTGNANLLDATTSVRNNGSVAATILQIVVTLPFSATAMNSVTSGWSLKSGSGTVWTFEKSNSLGANATDGFTARFAVANYAGGTIKGTASASNVPSSVDSTGSIGIAPTLSVDLLNAAATGGYVPPTSTGNDAGDKPWTMDFRVRNNGARSIKNIVVTFASTKSFSGLTVPANSGWTVTSSGNTVTATYAGIIAPGAILASANVAFTTKGNSTITMSTGTPTAVSAY
jgi:hypothetical protein